jgi:hypothetical protein
MTGSWTYAHGRHKDPDEESAEEGCVGLDGSSRGVHAQIRSTRTVTGRRRAWAEGAGGGLGRRAVAEVELLEAAGSRRRREKRGSVCIRSRGAGSAPAASMSTVEEMPRMPHEGMPQLTDEGMNRASNVNVGPSKDPQTTPLPMWSVMTPSSSSAMQLSAWKSMSAPPDTGREECLLELGLLILI